MTLDQRLSAVFTAINELADAAASGTGINDTGTSASSVWSSSKVQQMLDALKADILDGAPAALDTLKELAAYVEQDRTGAAAVSEAINNRVRFDAAQQLTPSHQLQACQNIGIGNPDTDFVAVYTAAKA